MGDLHFLPEEGGVPAAWEMTERASAVGSDAHIAPLLPRAMTRRGAAEGMDLQSIAFRGGLLRSRLSSIRVGPPAFQVCRPERRPKPEPKDPYSGVGLEDTGPSAAWGHAALRNSAVGAGAFDGPPFPAGTRPS